jgi:hypothetical protein
MSICRSRSRVVIIWYWQVGGSVFITRGCSEEYDQTCLCVLKEIVYAT